MARAWQEQRGQVDEQARRILHALDDRPHGVAAAPPGRGQLADAARALMERADRAHGGFGGAPKFPTPTNLELLLAARTELPPAEADDVLRFVAYTCSQMASRGLYDQLGGGFHRYCVDDHWGVPHFEKMLYDQGQLVRLYTDVWCAGGAREEELVWPVRETAAWLRREMTADDGGFFASQDADSEGEEGRFYVWTPHEIDEVLGPERGAAFRRAYGVTERGNFEGHTVLWNVAAGPRPRFAAERQALLERRGTRVPPATDRKRIAGWNGLAVSGLAYAGSLLPDPETLRDAVAAADFVLARMRTPDGRLLRVFAEGEAKIPAFLDDLAAVLAACLDLFRAGAGERFLAAALELAGDVAERFFDPDQNDLFLTPADGEPLVHRPRSDHDGATPHSTGLAVLGLLRAATLAGSEPLARVAERVLRTHAFALERAAVAFPTLVRAAAWAERGLAVAVVVGEPDDPATQALALAARRGLSPDEAVVVAAPGAPPPPGIDPTWLAGRGLAGGRPAAYVCRGTTCSLPLTDPAALLPLPVPV
jgi:uncharacterized protein YyaL (SSP411 family)